MDSQQFLSQILAKWIFIQFSGISSASQSWSQASEERKNKELNIKMECLM